MLHFYCKNSLLVAFFNDKSKAVRLLDQVTADLTQMRVFLAFKMLNITQIGKELRLQIPNKVLGAKLTIKKSYKCFF